VGEEVVDVVVVAEGLVAASLAAAADVGLWTAVDGTVACVVKGRMLVSRGFESGSVSGVLVADVVHSSPSADGKPLEASAYVFDKVPRVEGIQ